MPPRRIEDDPTLPSVDLSAIGTPPPVSRDFDAAPEPVAWSERATTTAIAIGIAVVLAWGALGALLVLG